MDAERAWQSALGQLQLEMPKASFDTWVRDAHLISYEEGHVTIGVRNAYAREWLEARLSSTLTRLLMGIMNRDVEVKFIVAERTTDELAESDDDEEKDVTEGFTAEIADPTRYAEEVQPDRIVLIPGYCLRLLEQGDLTPKGMSLWLGFRQAVYRQWRQGQGTVKNIPHWEVMRFAMMSRASYFRELSARDESNGQETLAGGLVEIIPEPAFRPAHDRRQENANRYRVYMSPRLTRRDCVVIERILTAEASMAATLAEAQDAVLAALNRLVEHDPAGYLEQDAEPGKNWPRDVQEIMRRVAGIEGDMPGDLANAGERLYDRIVAAYGKVWITHYFLREVVPMLELNHAQAWAIIMLRDRCWYDYETNTQKEFAFVAGGIDTLARWVGVSRKSVERWLS